VEIKEEHKEFSVILNPNVLTPLHGFPDQKSSFKIIWIREDLLEYRMTMSVNVKDVTYEWSMDDQFSLVLIPHLP
jgi:hypothetical protein